MQYLTVTKDDTMVSIGKIVGQQNMDLLLAENSLARNPKIGKMWKDKCDKIVAETPNEVTASRKSALLNNLVDSEEVFEKACLMDEDEWKVFSAIQAFPDAMRVPESIKLPYSTRVIGGTLGDVQAAVIGNVQGVEPVSPVTYKAVMDSLKLTASISPSIFNTVNTSPAFVVEHEAKIETPIPQYAYNLPWGKIMMYSSLLKEGIEFPVYPEGMEITRQANYTSMPDIIYQYEPWVVYESSGPREQSLVFHMHRDLWTGNHLDGNANKLIRFCEANTFPRYSGSSVLAPLVRFYISGSLFIQGVLTTTTVHWDQNSPIGLDNWYLDFTLTLTIQEVSDAPLNIDSVLKKGIIG